MRSSTTKKLIFIAIILTILVFISQFFQVNYMKVENFPNERGKTAPVEREKGTADKIEAPVQQPDESEKEKNNEIILMSVEEELDLLRSSETPFEAKMNNIAASRLGRVAEFCERNNLTDDFVDLILPNAYPNILVSDQHKAIFCSIGDVNSENLKKILKQAPSKSEKVSAPLRTLTSYRKESVSYRLKYYHKFMLVKEPMVRLFSVYKTWLLPHPNILPNGSVEHAVEVLHDLSRKIRVGFDPESFYNREPNATKYARLSDFANHIINQSSEGRQPNPLWDTYQALCSPCAVRYDYVMRSETVSDDAKFVFSKLKEASEKTYSVGHMDSSDSESIKELRHGLTAELADALYQVYRRDFELFGYPKPWN